MVTYLLDDLCGAGLVERQLNPADRRNRRIVLTVRGAEQLCVFERRLRQVEQHVIGNLGESDAALLSSLLGRAARGLQRSDTTTCIRINDLGGPG